jgi:hypothetical protein
MFGSGNAGENSCSHKKTDQNGDIQGPFHDDLLLVVEVIDVCLCFRKTKATLIVLHMIGFVRFYLLFLFFVVMTTAASSFAHHHEKEDTNHQIPENVCPCSVHKNLI